jgi:hypothetical protein
VVQTRCPSCKRSLKLADNFEGKSIRCPACKNVFRMETPLEEVIPVEEPDPAEHIVKRPASAPPPAKGDAFTDEEPPARPQRRRRPADDFDEEEYDADRPRRALNQAARSLLFAFLMNLIAFVVYAVILFTLESIIPGAKEGLIIRFLIVGASFLVPTFVTLIAWSFLRKLRGKGLVIIGCIMAFITSAEVLAYLGMNLESLRLRFQAPDLLPFVLLHLITLVLALVCGVSAGIRGLIALEHYQ